MLIALMVPLVAVTRLFTFAVFRNAWAQRALPAPEAIIVGAALRWLVFVVVLYAAAVMIRAALSSRREERLLTPEAVLAA